MYHGVLVFLRHHVVRIRGYDVLASGYWSSKHPESKDHTGLRPVTRT